jgi:hypothetical protein
MKKLILFLALTAISIVSFAQTWSTNTGILYANPTTTKIGIGTTAPLAFLHIKNTGECIRLEAIGPAVSYMTFYTGATLNGSIGFNYTTISTLNITTNASTPILFNTNNTERMRIDATGNVLIGKTTQTNSTYKLEVEGKVRATEIVVNSTGADFVFENNYKPRTLAELEQFVKTNKHLPEIPAASEMQTKGVSVSDMQTKLLQKVEELTLYMIELKKENEILKAEIEKLKNK